MGGLYEGHSGPDSAGAAGRPFGGVPPGRALMQHTLGIKPLPEKPHTCGNTSRSSSSYTVGQSFMKTHVPYFL